MYNTKVIHQLQNEINKLPITELEQYVNGQLVSKGLRADGAFYVTWNITNLCNLACIYCSNENENASIFEVDLDKKLEIINTLAKNNTKHVKLLGGEPTISDSFNKVLDSLLSRNIFVSFSTNGAGITKETVDVLRKYSPTMYRISISLDSSNDVHNDMNRGQGSGMIAKNAVALLIENIADIELDIISVLTPFNKRDILETYYYAKDVGIKRIGITLVLLSGRASNEMLLDITDDLLTDLLKLTEFAKRDNIKICTMGLGYSVFSCYDDKNKSHYSLSDEDAEIIFRRKCNACITRLHIDSNGDVYPCDNLKFPEFYLGNILRDKYEAIWDNERARLIRNVSRKEKEGCSKCPIKTCSTGCMGLSYGKDKTIYKKDPNCEVLYV